MPVTADIAVAFVDTAGQAEYLRQPGDLARRMGKRFEFAEQGRCLNMLFRRQVLVADDQKAVFEQRRLQLGVELRAWCIEADALDHGTKAGAKWSDVHTVFRIQQSVLDSAKAVMMYSCVVEVEWLHCSATTHK